MKKSRDLFGNSRLFFYFLQASMNIKTKRKMTVIERFLKYVSFDTQSDRE